jgi:hypothetical protein
MIPIAGLLVALALPAAPATPTPSAPAEISGQFGGRGALLKAASDGGRLELDCAHAAIRAPLTLDRDGRFRLPGSFVQERPGPTREGRDDGVPAVFEGSVEGATLTLRITFPDSREPLGPFTLTRDAPPRIRKCQ